MPEGARNVKGVAEGCKHGVLEGDTRLKHIRDDATGKKPGRWALGVY
jgi:hypothetical protein